MPEQPTNPPPQDVPEVPETTPEPKPKSKKKIIIIIAVVVVLGLLILVANFVAIRYLLNKDFSSPDTVEAPQETVQNTVYTSDFGFTLIYPSNIDLEEVEGGIDLTKWGPTQIENAGFFDALLLEVSVGSLEGKTLEDHITEVIEYATQREAILKRELIKSTFDSYESYEFTLGSLGERRYVYFLNPNKEGIYVKIVNGSEDPTNQGFGALVEEILSTLKFVNLTTYSDPELDFYFKFPSEFARRKSSDTLLLFCNSFDTCVSARKGSFFKRSLQNIDKLKEEVKDGDPTTGKVLVNGREAYTDQLMSNEGGFIAEAHVLTDEAIFNFAATSPTEGLSQEAKMQVRKDTEWLRDLVLSTVEFADTGYKVYTDGSALFTLRYPLGVVLNGDSFRGPDESEELFLNVQVDKLDELEDVLPDGWGKEGALKDKEALLNGEYGNVGGWSLEGSRKVLNFRKANAKSFVVFGRFEVCDVVFQRRAIFYNGDGYRVVLTLTGSRDLINELPEKYVEYNKDACGEGRAWGDVGSQEQLYQDLVNGKAPVLVQAWFDAFDEIISTIETF